LYLIVEKKSGQGWSVENNLKIILKSHDINIIVAQITDNIDVVNCNLLL